PGAGLLPGAAVHLRGPGAGGRHGPLRPPGGGGGQGPAGADPEDALRGDPARGDRLVPAPRGVLAPGGPAGPRPALRRGGARGGRPAGGLPPLRGRGGAAGEGQGGGGRAGGQPVIAAWALVWSASLGAGEVDCSKVEPAPAPDPAAAAAYLEVGDGEL